MGTFSYYEVSRQGAAEHHKQRTKEDPMMNENTKTNTKKNVLEMPESALSEVNGGAIRLPRDTYKNLVGAYYHRNCGGRIEPNYDLAGPRTPVDWCCASCGETHEMLDRFNWYQMPRNQGGNPEY